MRRRRSVVGFAVFVHGSDREPVRRHLHHGLGEGRVDALAHERQAVLAEGPPPVEARLSLSEGGSGSCEQQ